MRDLKKDLETCNSATAGPWKWITKGNTVQSRAITTDTGECGVQEKICASISPKTFNAQFVAAAREGWPEAIERAIAAEEEFKNEKKYCIEMSTEYLKIINKNNEKLHETENQLSALREANDLQRHSIQQLSAQLADYRKVIMDCPIEAQDGCNCPDCKAVRRCENVLQGDPGAEIMERMKKLEAVAEALRNYRKFASVYCDQQENIAWQKAEKALAALEGSAHE